jgi:hypothetical protein
MPAYCALRLADQEIVHAAEVSNKMATLISVAFDTITLPCRKSCTFVNRRKSPRRDDE